jgi:hypothetical protein
MQLSAAPFRSFLHAMWPLAWIRWWFRSRQGTLDAEMRDDIGFILAATLTLLGLIIGFSFSMDTSRYDRRKNYEAAEANACYFDKPSQGPFSKRTRAVDSHRFGAAVTPTSASKRYGLPQKF